MPASNRLSATRAAKITQPGRYADGNGLWLQVKASGTRSWLFRFNSPTIPDPKKPSQGMARHMGLGPLRDVSLAEARAKASDCRKLLLKEIDPIEERLEAKKRSNLEAARTMTFGQCARAYIAAHESTWRNSKHRQQWRNTLETYVYPVIGELPVAEVDTGLVMKIIEQLWHEKPETASRVRGRIEVILNWAKARGHRKGDNPATWRGHLDQLLPAKRKVRKVRHHPALPFALLPTFMAELRERDGISARALEFAILTATRTGETIGATWDQIEGEVWTIPAQRMKGGREHRIPLSGRAREILRDLPHEGDIVFPGARRGAGLSNMALLATLRRMGRSDLTAHGFRSTFRDWASECTTYPSDVCEAALAHAVADKTEAAYRRGDLFQKRRWLMADWCKYCSVPPKSGEVVPLRSGV